MNREKIPIVLEYLNSYANSQLSQGKRNTRELFPSFEHIRKNCNMKKVDDVKKIIDILEDKGEVIRFTSQRYLRWVWDRLNKKPSNPIGSNINGNTFSHIYKDDLAKLQKKLKKIRVSSLLIIKILITLPALIATIMSIHYTRIWFTNYLPTFLASISSVAIVLSNIGAFESLFLFAKKKQVLQIILATFIFLITCSFSIGTTLAGQMNVELKNKNTFIINRSNKKHIQIERYKQMISSSNEDLERLRKEYDHNIEQKELNQDNTRDYWNFNYLAFLRKKEMNKLKEEIKEYETKIENLINSNEDNITNIFFWLRELFSFDPDITKFILYMIPAIFYDIISPFFFAIIFFYKEER